MSDTPEVTVWQVAQATGFAAVVGFAGEALRRAFALGGKVALIEKAQADQALVNAETRAALEASLKNHYELKAVLASLPTREEMRQMLADSGDGRRPRNRTP